MRRLWCDGSHVRKPIGLIFAVTCLFLQALPVQANEWRFEDVEKIVAFGDVHGAYDALVETLQNADVIDDNLAWSGGRTHLVSTGDLVDRGAESRRVMDLMMRLEREALLAGGRVHQLLGNHEVMNLIGDLRYVVSEEYAAFRDYESPEKRAYWFQQFRLGKPPDGEVDVIREEFEQLAPPGYFGHRRAFARNGLYGKWLLEKPFMIVINNTAFVHGGAPAYLVEHGLAGINGTLKEHLLEFMQSAETLMDAGVLTPVDRSKQMPGKLSAMLEAGQLQGELAAPAQELIDRARSPLHGQPGPTWYRGSAQCSRFVESPVLGPALDELEASRIVVGHSTTTTRRVEQRLHGRVITIDTGMLNDVYGGSGNALVIENGEVRVVNQHGDRRVAPLEQPLQVGFEDASISEDDLARILEQGQIIAVAAEGAEWQLVKVTDGNVAILASFRALPGEGRFAPELAAYLLDRQLQLGMVPVTVLRTVAGRKGTLQFVPGVTLTERGRVAASEGKNATCAVGKQIDAMFVFDALLGNVARSPSSMVYDRSDWSLMLVDHDSAFSTDESLPAELVNIGLVIGDEWRVALDEINDKLLRDKLGDVLDKKHLQALSKRRDALQALAAQR